LHTNAPIGSANIVNFWEKHSIRAIFSTYFKEIKAQNIFHPQNLAFLSYSYIYVVVLQQQYMRYRIKKIEMWIDLTDNKENGEGKAEKPNT